MSEKESQPVRITITTAVHRTGLPARAVRRFIRCGLVGEPLAEADLAELRRARRLTELGVNLAGVEVILRMRCRIEELQTRLAALGVGMRPFSRLPEMPEAGVLISPEGREKEDING